MLCQVTLGEVFSAEDDGHELGWANAKLGWDKAKLNRLVLDKGLHTVAARPQPSATTSIKNINHDETVVYKSEQAVPMCVVVYELDTKQRRRSL